MYHICPCQSQAQFGGCQRPQDKWHNPVGPCGGLQLALSIGRGIGRLDNDRWRSLASHRALDLIKAKNKLARTPRETKVAKHPFDQASLCSSGQAGIGDDSCLRGT